MKLRFYHFAFLAALAVFFWGCPYNGSHPISDKTNSKINKDLLGTWKGSNQGSLIEAEVSKYNDNEYFVRYFEINSADTEHKTTFYRAHESNLRGTIILNIHACNSKGHEPSTTSWYFYNYKVNGGEMETKAISSDWFDADEHKVEVDGELQRQSFDTQEEWADYVRENVGKEDFWSDYMTWERVK